MFHDTLPGSSIHLAVEDYDRKFAEIHQTAKDLFYEAIEALRDDRKTSSSVVSYINTLPSLPRREVVCREDGRWSVASVDLASMCGTTQDLHPNEGVTSGCTSQTTPVPKLTGNSLQERRCDQDEQLESRGHHHPRQDHECLRQG